MANENKSGYEHYIPMVPEDLAWEDKLSLHLVRSIEEFKKIIEDNKDKKYVAFDTETTGLNADVDRIVGFSIAFSMNEGWYIPIRHVLGNSLDPKTCLDLLYDLLLSKVMVFMYNMRFDTRMMEVEGYDMSKCHIYEVQLAVYLADTNYKRTNLKLAERRWLGWLPDTFIQTVGNKENFSYTDPEESHMYACVDACGTFGVAQQTIKFYKESGVAGRVLNEAMYVFMKFEDIKYEIDKDYLLKCQFELTQRMKDLEHEIYNEIGYQFKIGSNVQLGNALQSVGINTNSYTKKGAMKVDIETLEYINRTLKLPLIDNLIKYSQLTKLGNSYIDTLLEQGEKKDYKLRFHYILGGTGGASSDDKGSAPTGRVSSGSDKKNDYFANLNIMAVPKPHPKMYYVHKYTEGDEVKEGDIIILNWRFSLEDKSDYMAEGMDPYLNPRAAFIPPEGWYIVARDFSAQELRMQAALANAKNWLNTFNSGGDLHETMAKQIWGKENYNKAYRRKAKALNFGLLYGMSAYTMSDRIDETVDETKVIINKYWKGCPEIPAYQKAVLRKAKKNGTIYTYFGLPRRVKYYLESSNPRTRAFGERTCYDEETEILTPSGWKYLKDVSNGDEVAQYSDGYLEYVPAQDKVEVISDDAIVFESRAVSLKVTPNHRMLVSYDKHNWGVKQASELVGDSFYYFKSAAKRKYVDSVRIIDTPIGSMSEVDFAKFIGWHIADGSLDIDKRNESRSVKISQTKKENFSEIRSIFTGFKEYETSKGHVWVKTHRDLYEYLIDFYKGRLKVDRTLPSWFLELGNDSLEEFLRAFIKADGTYHSNGADIYHPSFSLLCQVQLICMYLGYRSKVSELKEKSGTIIGRLQITFTDVVSIDGRIRKDGLRQIRVEKCNREKFYCISVPSTFLVVRRKGKISVQGNCANTMIQGSCSTMTLLAAIKMWNKIYSTEEWKDKCRFQTYIHDEIVSAVRADKVAEFGLLQKECMETDFPGLPIKFETSMSIGVSWGLQFDFHYTDTGELEPDMEKVEE